MEITPCRKPWKGSMTARERFNAQMHYKPCCPGSGTRHILRFYDWPDPEYACFFITWI
jgi:hypothetical protein